MDDETPEMEQLSQRMRGVMAAWVKDPQNGTLKGEYQTLQQRYQHLFTAYKRAQAHNGAA